MQLIDVAGDGFARGFDQGRALAPQIAAHLGDWLKALGAATGGDGEAWARSLLKETDFRSALEAHAPDLLQEVEGLAQGAGLDADLVFALQLLDEEWSYRERRQGAAGPFEKCSSLAVVVPGGATFIGQNMDLGVYTDTHQLALRIAPAAGRPGALLFTLAGFLGLMGVNDAGLGVCVNAMPQFPSAPTGVPVAFMIRKVLQARDFSEAVACVQSLPHATNQHYLLAEHGVARSFECSAAGVVDYRPSDPAVVLHTNHPLGPIGAGREIAQEGADSQARLLSLRQRLGAGACTLAAIKEALCAFDDPQYPVCRVYAPAAGLMGFTTGSMITALERRPASLVSHMSAGPPSVARYEAFTLKGQGRLT